MAMRRTKPRDPSSITRPGYLDLPVRSNLPRGGKRSLAAQRFAREALRHHATEPKIIGADPPANRREKFAYRGD